MSQYPQVPPPYSQAPPPPGFVPPPQPPHTVLQTTIIHASEFGETPQRMVCPSCRSEIITAISYDFSLAQHIAFFVMCITGACCICSCIPYCCTSLSNVKHECPNCHTHVGTFTRC